MRGSTVFLTLELEKTTQPNYIADRLEKGPGNTYYMHGSYQYTPLFMKLCIPDAMTCMVRQTSYVH